MNKEADKAKDDAPRIVADVHEAALRARIRALLDLPMNKRTNFLRTRLPSGGSCI